MPKVHIHSTSKSKLIKTFYDLHGVKADTDVDRRRIEYFMVCDGRNIEVEDLSLWTTLAEMRFN